MKMSTKWRVLSIPFIAGFLMFYVLPFGRSIYYSLIESAFNHSFVGLSNYQAVLNNKYYCLALGNTLKFTLIGTMLLMLLSLFLSLFLYSSKSYLARLRIVFIMPMLLPTAAIIPIFKQLFPSSVLYHLMSNCNVMPLLWLPVLLLYLWKNTGYNMILLMAAFSGIPHEIYEAAALDGAEGLKKLVRITLPMIRPTIFFIIVMSIMQSLRIFKETYLLYGSYPDESIYLVQNYMNNHFNKLDYQNLTAGAILFSLPIGCMMIFYYFLEKRWARII